MALIQTSKLVAREDTLIHVVGEITHELLATTVQDPDLYAERMKVALEESEIPADQQDALILEEIDTLPPAEEGAKTVTVFRRDEKGIFLDQYQFKGFLKAAGEAMRQTKPEVKLGSKGTKWGAIKGKIDRFIRIAPERIYLTREVNGVETPITEPDGICTRPLRGMTARGERITITRSESVSPGAKFKLAIDIMDNAPITESMVVEMLAYGERVGLLQWRNSGKGRFISYIDAPDGWVPSDTVQ